MKPRIVLARLPGHDRIHEHSPPLGIASLAGYLRRNGQFPSIELACLDFLPSNVSNNLVIDRIASMEPALLGLSYLTVQADDAHEIIAGIRARCPTCLIVTGWSHTTARPEDALVAGADVAVAGEGERPWAQLVSEVVAGRRGGGAVDLSNSGSLRAAKDLLPGESIPAPAWDLLDLSLPYNDTAHFDDLPALPVMASRGCAFDCSFCGSKNVWLGRVRFRPIPAVIDELRQAERLGYRRVHFYDDDFLIRREYTESLCIAMMGAGLSFEWVCLATVRMILRNRASLALLVRAGCRGVEFGFESGDEAVLGLVGKQQKRAEIVEAIRALRDAGIEYMDPLSMVFNEGETPTSQADEITLLDQAEFQRQPIRTHQFASPYPGTAFGERATRVGTVTARRWSEYRSDRINFVPHAFSRSPAPAMTWSQEWAACLGGAINWEAAVELPAAVAVACAEIYARVAAGELTVEDLALRIAAETGLPAPRCLSLTALLACYAARQPFEDWGSI